MNKSQGSPAHHRQFPEITLMAGVVALLLLPPFAYAQQSDGRPASQLNSSMTITPHIGMYIPVGSLVADDTIRLRPVASIALGSRLALPVNGLFSIEGTLSWSPNLVAQSVWQQTIDLEGGVWFGSARIAARIAGRSPDSETAASITTGIGVVHRYGDAWNGMTGTTDAALVVGGGLRYVEIDSGITFTLDVDGFLTRTGFTDTGRRFYGDRLQKDFIVTFGTSINLSR